MMKKWFPILILFLFPAFTQAKHITGGEMIYDLISSTPTTRTFRVTLILFRDENCLNCADMPAVVRIGIYNNDNNEPYGGAGTQPTIDVNLLRTTTLPITNVPLCISNQPTLTYRAGYYPFVITLNNNDRGYTAAYQTCCRIDNINNIVNGVNGAGATYATVIPGSNNPGILSTDNSPRFTEGISIVCQDKPFIIDFSATDPDGDRLVYSLCDAYNGGDAQNAANITPSVPPYGSLDYSNGFSGAQPLGGTATINPQTGIITGIAPASGKYVLAVCVSSYRGNVLLSTHRKDFIITVADCDFASAELDPDYITCDGFSFTFSNQNSSPLNQTFYWDFGDPGSGANNISTSETPTHTFSAAGVYIVKFVVNRGTSCADSIFTRIAVYPGYFPEFTSNSPICKGNPVQFRDQTRANYGAVNEWHWDFGLNNVSSDTSIVQNPQFIYNQIGTYQVTLIVGSDKGCIDTITNTVEIVDKPVLNVTNDTLICSVDNLSLNATSSIAGTYSWTPNYNISNTNIPNPVVSPDVTTTYYVSYTDNFGCNNRDSVVVRVVDSVSMSTGRDTTICRTDGIPIPLVSNALTYSWRPSTYLNNANIKNPISTPLVPSITYYVQGNIGSCFDTDSIVIKTIPYPRPDAGNDTLICWGTNAFLSATGGSSYTWSPSAFLTATNIPNPTSVRPDATFIDYIVSVTDTFGCPKSVSDTMRLTIDKIIANAGPRDTAVVAGQPLQLNATGSSNYLWTPVTQWLSNPRIPNPVSNPRGDIEYVVRVSNSIGCFDTDTIQVKFYTVLPDFFVPAAFSPNGDGLNEIIKPIALGLRSIEKFMIYNRWGQLMFSTSRIGDGWNGRRGGKVQEAGTYVWYAEGTDYTNKKLQRKGTIILIR
jgi:gliding motility-associated-like protein